MLVSVTELIYLAGNYLQEVIILCCYRYCEVDRVLKSIYKRDVSIDDSG